MAYNKVTIDVEARFVDNVTGQAKKVNKIIDDLDKKNPEVEVNVEDNASKTLNKIEEKTKRLANKITDIPIKLRDNETLAKLSKIEEKARHLAGRTWTAAIRIKDMATAPIRAITRQLFSLRTLAAGIIGGMATNKYVIQPTQMYANYEDLVTQFSVLLKGKSKTPNYDAAKARIDELTAFAGQTPFTRDEIYQASRVLQTYTQGALATPDSTGGLRMIGDIAAATGAEYTQVATYMGRLYNEVKRGGESLGEPLAFLREMGALSAEQEEKIKAIAEGSGSIEEKWKKIAGQFSATDGMMLEMSNQMNNLMLGVKSFLKNNLYMKLGEGISQSLKPFLIDFRKWRNDNSDLIASWAEQIKDFAASASEKVLGIVRRTASRANKIMQSEEFQQADIFGKIGMLWKGAIANPFAEWWTNTVVPWWDRTAVPWLQTKAGELGNTIGTGLSNGLLTLLGVDVAGAADQGGSIASSFVQGFLDGFDGSAVTEAIIDSIVAVWDALPAWGKVLVGGLGVSKAAGGIASLAGGVANFMGLIGSASKGTGLLGMGANAAIGMGAGNLAGGASLGAGALSLLGLGGIAGGATGAITALRGGYDIYQGYKNNDNTLKNAGMVQVGGAGFGAAMGAIMGSVVPGIGTLVGGLLGAGIGGLGGLLGSNKIKKNAAENAASLKELEDQTASNAKASDALADRQEALAKSLGDVKLSYAEIQTVASNTLFDSDTTKKMQDYSSATVKANKAILSLASSTEELNKWNWKASIGFKFNKEDKESYKKAVKEYIDNAESVVENEHYRFTAAVTMLIDPKSEGGKGILESGNAFYSKLQEKLSKTQTKLTKQIDIALKDGVIDANEAEIIEKLQKKISSITQKVAQAETEAKLEVLKIKFGSGAIDSETFQQLQQELSDQIGSSKLQYEEALTVGLSSLKLQYPEGGTAYEDAKNLLVEEFEKNIDGLNVKAKNLQLEILGDAYENILGEDGATKLNEALQTSIDEGIAPMNWTEEQAERMLGVENLTPQLATGIGTALQSVAENTMPEKVAELANATKTQVDTQVRSKLAEGLSADLPLEVKVHPTYSGLPAGLSLSTGGTAKARGGLVGMSIPGYSGGGMVRGGAQVALLAEEGTPEMVIPLGLQRRMRGLKLWEKAGQMLGVPGFAQGGLVGGSGDEGLRYQQYGGGNSAGSGSQGVQVNVGGVTVEINVDGNEGGNIVEAIKAKGNEIADTVAGILADAFISQFQNTPARGGA